MQTILVDSKSNLTEMQIMQIAFDAVRGRSTGLFGSKIVREPRQGEDKQGIVHVLESSNGNLLGAFWYDVYDL